MNLKKNPIKNSSVHLRMPSETKAKLESIAADNGISLSDHIRQVLERYLTNRRRRQSRHV